MLTVKTLTSQQIYTGSPEPRQSNKISCAGSNGDLLLFCASSKGSGESTHLHRLTLAFVTVPKSHALPQMAISVLFTPAGRLMSLHICAGIVTGQWRVYTFAHVPRSTSYGVYISQLIRFARASSYVADFNTRNKLLTQKLLKQGYRYHKLRKTFSKFYRQYYDLISKFQVGLKSLLRQGLSEPDFYGDLVYKLKKIVSSNNFSARSLK